MMRAFVLLLLTSLTVDVAGAQNTSITPKQLQAAEVVGAQNLAFDHMTRYCQDELTKEGVGPDALYDQWRERNTKLLQAGFRVVRMVIDSAKQRGGMDGMLAVQNVLANDVAREKDAMIALWTNGVEKPDACKRFLAMARAGEFDFSPQSTIWPRVQELAVVDR